MPGRQRHDWPLMKQDYASSTLGLRQIAAKYGISERAVMSRSRKEGWPQARVEHFSRVAAKVQRSTEGKQVQAEVSTKDAVRTVLRGVIRRFAELVRANAAEISPHDFIEAAKLALLLEGMLPADQLQVMFGKPVEDLTDDEIARGIVQLAEDIATGRVADPA